MCVEGSSLKEHTHQCESHKIQTRLSLTTARLGASISRIARKIGLPTEKCFSTSEVEMSKILSGQNLEEGISRHVNKYNSSVI